MAEPFAVTSDYTARGYDATKFDTGVLDMRLAAASRHLRALSSTIDARIAAGTLDAALVTDVVCAMVARTVPAENMQGVHTFQTSVGPFQDSVRLANPGGDLYLTKGERRTLGISSQRAFSVSLIGDDASDESSSSSA